MSRRLGISLLLLLLLLSTGAATAVFMLHRAHDKGTTHAVARDLASGWLAGVLSSDELQSIADRVGARLERAIASSLDTARAEIARQHGVHVLADDRDPDDRLIWTPLAERPELPQHLVLLIHGLDEPGDIWDDLAPALQAHGHAVARFDYPNDQAAARSAEALVLELEQLRSRGAHRLDLVCHSMGGLIARDVLTRPTMYAGQPRGHDTLPNIESLITVGTPNRGSPFARFRFVAELREQVFRAIEDGRVETSRLVAFLADGAGQAGDDLEPGSPYLQDLNARPRPEPLDITVVIGQMTPDDVRALSGVLNAPLVRRILSEQGVAATDATAEALIDLLGDGVVPADSARLPGADQTVFVEGNHRSILRRLPLEDQARALIGDAPRRPPAVEVILQHLEHSGDGPQDTPPSAPAPAESS